MENQFARTQLLLGDKAMESIRNARIAVFGIGGVGGHVVEALVRCGVENIDLIDNDIVSLSNLNRQIIATRATVGRYKVDVMRDRIQSINPEVNVNVHKCFYLPDKSEEFDFSNYTYIVDAIDTVTAKIELVICADKAGVPIISCMGTGNKLDPKQFQVADIYKTSMCPLAKVMRHELRKRGIKKLKVVYSTEKPAKVFSIFSSKGENEKKKAPGSVSFVPAVAGLVMASEIVMDLVKDVNKL